MLSRAKQHRREWLKEIDALEEELELREVVTVPDDKRYFLVRMTDLVTLLQAEADLNSLYIAGVENWMIDNKVDWQEPMSLQEFNEGPNNADV